MAGVRDPVTGRWLKGPGGKPGTLTAKKLRLKLAEKETQVAAIESDEMPLPCHAFSRREPERAFQAAKAAAPYCHPQLQAIALRSLGPDGKPVAFVVNLTVMQPPEPRPRLPSTGPKSDHTVQ